jgi:predicted esterase
MDTEVEAPMNRSVNDQSRFFRHRSLVFIASLCLLVISLYLVGEGYRRVDYSGKFREMHGMITTSEIELESRLGDHSFHSLNLMSDKGIRVSAYLKVPARKEKSYPALVILGGLRTGRRTVRYLQGSTDIVIMTLDYPYHGKRENLSALEFVGSIPEIRRAILETVPSVMLGIDYLLNREDVDPERIVMVGGSLGALFVPAIMAADHRISGAAILFGGADIRRLIVADLELPSPLAAITSWICAVFVSPVEPLKYVGKISPRPLYMLNGMDDKRIPLECSRLLHIAAGNPKTVKWIQEGHLNVKSEEFHRKVSNQLSQWLVSEGLIESGSFSY